MARDLFHSVVKDALIKEGWQITHDPFPVDYGDVQMQIDLGAEQLIAATKDRETIAVEVKNFINPSAISEFHIAVTAPVTYKANPESLVFRDFQSQICTTPGTEPLYGRIQRLWEG
jgi:XisH protein